MDGAWVGGWKFPPRKSIQKETVNRVVLHWWEGRNLSEYWTYTSWGESLFHGGGTARKLSRIFES